jgi:thiol:disulfide interchange protein
VKTRTALWIGTSLILAGLALSAHGADGSATAARPPIYDEKADASQQIAVALEAAKKENKRVLLQFGANWCIWCHRLHNLCETNSEVSAILRDAYIVVLIDVNKEHNKEVDTRYETPTRFGLPALVILDADGKALVTEDSGKLEEGDHHDPKKVLAFLNQWAGKKR